MKRDTDLRRTNVIGSVKHSKESRDHFRPRPVKFKWQRGIKIGQGRFGKVIFFFILNKKYETSEIM